MLGGAVAIEAVRLNESTAYAGVQGVHWQGDAATMLRRAYLPDDVVANIDTGAKCGANVEFIHIPFCSLDTSRTR